MQAESRTQVFGKARTQNSGTVKWGGSRSRRSVSVGGIPRSQLAALDNPARKADSTLGSTTPQRSLWAHPIIATDTGAGYRAIPPGG
jgi:hypothetical protein